MFKIAFCMFTRGHISMIIHDNDSWSWWMNYDELHLQLRCCQLRMHLVGIPTKWMRLPKGVRLGKKGPGGVGPKSSTKMVCFFCCFAPKNKKGISTQPSKIRDLHGFASDQRAKNTWSILVIWSWWEAGDCVGAPFETIVMLYLHNFRSSAVGHTIEMMNNLSIKSWPIMW